MKQEDLIVLALAGVAVYLIMKASGGKLTLPGIAATGGGPTTGDFSRADRRAYTAPPADDYTDYYGGGTSWADSFSV